MDEKPASASSVSFIFFPFFFFLMHANYTVHETLCIVHAMFTRPTTTLDSSLKIQPCDYLTKKYTSLS